MWEWDEKVRRNCSQLVQSAFNLLTFAPSAFRQTQEYYLHLFVPEQPDVNWENAELRRALYDEAVLFWLEKGCDGFR